MDHLHRCREEDERLRRDLPVLACWSEGGFSQQAQGIVHRLDRRTVTVRLLAGTGRHGRGALLVLPRFADQTAWSSTCCVRLPVKPPSRR